MDKLIPLMVAIPLGGGFLCPLVGKFVRTIHLWRTNPAESFKTLPPDEERVAAVTKLYGTRLEPVGEVVKFRGEFREMPPDVLRDKETNHGGYDVWRAGPGWVGFYRERRPGPTDLYARLEKAASGVDRLTKILAEMFRAQLPGEAGVDSLTAFLVGPLRTDLKEMMFVMATGSHSVLDDDALVSALAMVLQIAEERGYLDAADLPKITNRETGLELLLRMATLPLLARYVGPAAKGAMLLAAGHRDWRVRTGGADGLGFVKCWNDN